MEPYDGFGILYRCIWEGFMHSRGREEQIYHRAYDLAASGRYIEPITIISVLIAQGYAEAAEVLDGLTIRNDLRQVCFLHWHETFRQTPCQRWTAGLGPDQTRSISRHGKRLDVPLSDRRENGGDSALPSFLLQS
jgi:hypothetical protein